MRDGEDPASKNPANKTARDAGWQRMLALLRGEKAVAADLTASPGRRLDGRPVAQVAPLELCGAQ
jgi:hypothetical protein